MSLLRRKILIVDAHPVVREGLKRLFAPMDDIEVAAETGSGSEALDLIRQETYDGVLLEMTLPDRNGFDILRRLLGNEPPLRVLIMSSYAERLFAVHSLRMGAKGYIDKVAPEQEILRATRIVLAGGRYVSESLGRLAADAAFDSRASPLHERLSPREFEVFKRLAEGRSVSQVAQEFFVSTQTIQTHRIRIMDKMKLVTIGEMTRYAIDHQLIA